MRIERSKVKCPERSAGSLLNDFALHGLGFDALQYIVNFTQLVQCLAICNTVRSDDFLLQIQHAIAADAIDGPSAAASPTGAARCRCALCCEDEGPTSSLLGIVTHRVR